MCSRFSDLDSYALQAQTGSDSAFVVLYTRLAPVVLQFVRRKTYLPTLLAEDIAQEAWLVVVKKLDDWDPERGRFVAWVLMITNSQCSQYMRSVLRRRRTASLDEAEFDPPSSGTAESLGAIDDRQILLRALRTIPPRDREIIFLQAVCGLTSSEIAALLPGTPTSEAIRQRLVTIRKKLREALRRGRG